MNDKDLMSEASELSGWEKHRFLLLVGISIAISIVLVGVSLQLYESSGAAQLDLSRPGYEEITEKVAESKTFKGYSSLGEVDEDTISEFEAMYKKRAAQATNVDSFKGDNIMSDQALSIDSPDVEAAN